MRTFHIYSHVYGKPLGVLTQEDFPSLADCNAVVPDATLLERHGDTGRLYNHGGQPLAFVREE